MVLLKLRRSARKRLEKLGRILSPDQLSVQHHRVQPWFAINGDKSLRLDYPNLSPQSWPLKS